MEGWQQSHAGWPEVGVQSGNWLNRVSKLLRGTRRWGWGVKGFLRNVAEDCELDTL